MVTDVGLILELLLQEVFFVCLGLVYLEVVDWEDHAEAEEGCHYQTDLEWQVQEVYEYCTHEKPQNIAEIACS